MEKGIVRTVLITGCTRLLPDNGLPRPRRLPRVRNRALPLKAVAPTIPRHRTAAPGCHLGREHHLLRGKGVSHDGRDTRRAGSTIAAGAGYNMPILDESLADVKRQFELNVFSGVVVIRAFFPLWRTS